MNIIDDLESLKFECGIPEEERYWLYLHGRYRGLMIKGCAHAVFFCKVFSTLRELLHQSRRTIQPRAVSFDAADGEDGTLKVGIIGCGHLGRQLAKVLLKIVPIPAENLQISTRRPESLVEFQKLGVRCYYDNRSLASWAKVLFLCCLPAQLPNICLEIQSKLEKPCIVYSFVAAIPVPRPFPWFDLTVVQLKETPFSQHLSTTPILQEHLTLLYRKLLGIPVVKEEPPQTSTGSSPKGIRADREPSTVFEKCTNNECRRK
ncbi:NADP+ dependent oxidoreductase domain containing 1 [Cricetulus griseus]